MKVTATNYSQGTTVIGMADDKGYINSHRPFFVTIWSIPPRMAIHGFINENQSCDTPLNWIVAC